MNYYVIEHKYYDNDFGEHYFIYDDLLFKTSEQAQKFINKKILEECIITKLTLLEDK